MQIGIDKGVQMRFVEYGKNNRSVILLLHGGGMGTWNYRKEAELLKEKYHIVIPVLDGHNGSDRDFTTIEDNAGEIIAYIDENYEGHVLLIGGLSLGGQILVEMLSQRKDICKFAIIESARVLPMGAMSALIKPVFSLCYPLVKKHWFAKLQFDTYHIEDEYFDEYYCDSAAISKENMIAFLMANSNYKIKNELHESYTKVLVFAGGKEANVMRQSAKIIHRELPNAIMEIMPDFYHGDLSFNHFELYVNKMFSLMAD